MPKPQYFQSKQWNREERDYRGGDSRRVTFKPGRQGGNQYSRNHWGNALREHLEDEDIDMGISSGARHRFRSGKKKGRKGSPGPAQFRKLLEAPSGWYKVMIPYGEKYEKSFLQRLLLENVSPFPFMPMAWQTNGNTSIFYVDDFKLAEKLLSLDKKVQLPNGFKLFVRVHPSSPNVDMTDVVKERMKQVMAKRYNAETKALDLTKFHADPDFQDLFCPLFKPIVFFAVIDIISENIPDLEALNLTDNRIMALGFLKKLPMKIRNLKILYIGNNKLRDISQLDALIGLPLIELVLDGNPLCDRFKEQTIYISEVRKRFPRCLKLDGIELPPPISFDIAEETHLPDPCQKFLCNKEGEPIVCRFLEEYFRIYDSENRQPLLNAYHEHAMFSFTTAYPYGLGKDKNVAWLSWYNTENRNLVKVQDRDRRFKLLKQGQLSVVSFIQDMPNTKHDIHSFTFALTFFTPQMICLTVTGIFRELKTGHKIPPTRYFFRTLVIVPAGSGICIANEQLHVTNATSEQAQEAFKGPSIVPAPVPGTSAPPSTPEAVVPVPVAAPVLSDAAKKELIEQIALKTGMNLEYSIQCLEGNEWDLFRAFAAFETLKSQGSIPPQAFVK
ncbi:nuclear RNA export factor 1 [Cylas formicarius]|uniref:nuclear RNA export factor 1 n=1 Tax=Cylas formicarius TaxID=197179 RepID=UPI0029587644|nr:nuclear RNA export factor 1 [Cylas formicarius]